VHAAFGTVLWIVCIGGILLAFGLLIASSRTWQEFGRSRFTLDSEPSTGPRPSSSLERDTEIRQLLEARNARRLRRGEAPLDVEQELVRLTAPLVDDALRAEIRDLVIARNHRRARAGKPPLDVETEIEREIQSLTDLH
jgi:hypothetical protein